MTPSPAPAAVVAVDGGNSKADVALVAADGRLLASGRGPTVSHQQVGYDEAMRRLGRVALDVASGAGLGPLPIATLASCCLAGADYASDIRQLERAISATGIAGRTIVRNDTLGALRAGTSRRWGAVLICGHGINGAAIGRDGREIRFDALGDLSGDWGGGHDLGYAALGAAVRATDGRGPRTSLTASVPAAFGRKSVAAVVRDLYLERAERERIDRLAPLVFDAAASGDAVARGIVDRLADELVTMAGALLRRAGLSGEDPEIVLGGGVFRTTEPGFYARLDAGIRAIAPAARVVRLEAPPVLGAAILGLEDTGLDRGALEAAEARLRADFATARMES